METYDFFEYKDELLNDPEIKKEYAKLEPEFLLAEEIIQFRKDKKLTQKQLAEAMSTSQLAIARLEAGNYNKVSLDFLRRVAEALDAVPEIHFKKKKAFI